MGGGRLSSSRKNQSRKKRTDGLKRIVSSQISKGSFDKELITLDVPDCSAIANHAIHGGERYNNLWYKRAHVSMPHGLRRRLSSRTSKGSFDKKPVMPGVPNYSSFTYPAFQEIIEDAWFDSVAKFDYVVMMTTRVFLMMLYL
ncbi:hypothetical protein G2W53_010216 [Senna tora]|uniref:Uncharacterized protein n=1 Tax=Senna tora TaxID=362788 RepID=A0A834WZ82_9FABA|nr:hypothetical protein G2W53_010216 [Senna tora]